MNDVSTRGQIGLVGIVLLSVVVSVLILAYYAIFSLATMVFSPLYSIYVATGLYAVFALGLGVYRYKYGVIVPEKYRAERNQLPEVPEYTEDEDESLEDEDVSSEKGMIRSLLSGGERVAKGRQRSHSTDGSEKSESVEGTGSDMDEGADSTGRPSDVPRDLYMKTIAKDSYTIEDAREDAEKRE